MTSQQAWKSESFEQSINVWGYELQGKCILEVAAALAEDSYVPDFMWDKNAESLKGIVRIHGDEQVPVPLYWALPAVVQWVAFEGEWTAYRGIWT